MYICIFYGSFYNNRILYGCSKGLHCELTLCILLSPMFSTIWQILRNYPHVSLIFTYENIILMSQTENTSKATLESFFTHQDTM